MHILMLNHLMLICPQTNPQNMRLGIVGTSSEGNAFIVLRPVEPRPCIVHAISLSRCHRGLWHWTTFLLTRNAMLRMPLRHLRSMSLRWAKCTDRTGKPCRGSRPETLSLVTSWRSLVGWPALCCCHSFSSSSSLKMPVFAWWQKQASENHTNLNFYRALAVWLFASQWKRGIFSCISTEMKKRFCVLIWRVFAAHRLDESRFGHGSHLAQAWIETFSISHVPLQRWLTLQEWSILRRSH